MNTIEKQAADSTSAEAIKPSDTLKPADKPTKVKGLTCDAWKGTLEPEALIKAMNAARCDAGRINAEARKRGIGRVIVNAEGDNAFIPDARQIKAFRDAGLFGDTNSKEGKLKAAKKESEYRAYHALLAGLVAMGLVTRKDSK